MTLTADMDTLLRNQLPRSQLPMQIEEPGRKAQQQQSIIIYLWIAISRNTSLFVKTNLFKIIYIVLGQQQQ